MIKERDILQVGRRDQRVLLSKVGVSGKNG